jgi:phosphoserine/homoserine phosphotransferase
MNIACLDLEGVLVPEIWIAFAEKTGIPELKITTRDEPDYDKLMKFRIELLNKKGLTLKDIQEVIGSLEPLPGAMDFLNWLRTQTQVLILSDTFEEFARPLLPKLGNPTIFCHTLETQPSGKISGYKIRIPDQKRQTVIALKQLNFHVIAAGDSYNDLSMLQFSHHGIFFCPPEKIRKEYPKIPVANTHREMRSLIESYLKLA